MERSRREGGQWTQGGWLDDVESSPGRAKTLVAVPGKTVPGGAVAGTAGGGSSCTTPGSGPGTVQKRTCLLCQPSSGGRRCRMEGSASTVGSGGAAGASIVGSEGAANASTVGSVVVEEPGAECPPDPSRRGVVFAANHVTTPLHQYMAVFGVCR